MKKKATSSALKKFFIVDISTESRMMATYGFDAKNPKHAAVQAVQNFLYDIGDIVDFKDLTIRISVTKVK